MGTAPDEPREVTTFCPRCGQPIVWSVTPFVGGEQLEATGYACHCPLSEDEWDDLAAEAGDALQDRRHADDGGVRRVVEDDPA
jgi:hypothetical protein